jgi:ABC-2 type transport system ATP-binding protein
MSQKLQFVTTVLHDPKLIILDEPFSGLDPVNSNLIKDEIFKLAQKGSTVIFSTHRMEQVEEICNHIVLVNKGKKILDGTVKDVKQQFKENLFSIGTDQLPKLNGSSPFEKVGSREQLHIVRIREGRTSNDVLEFLLRQQRPVYSFNEILPSLNDIFIRLVEDTPATRQFQEIK